MNQLFNTPANSPLIIVLLSMYLVTSAITVFDIRLIQAKKSGLLPDDEPMLPNWVGVIAWLDWLIIIAVFLLNWRVAIIAIVVKFILKVLPVLEIIGNIIMSPFKSKRSN